MKILITGASGFIGNQLLHTLTGRYSADHEVVAVVRKLPVEDGRKIRWVLADLSLPEWTGQLPDEEFDTVIHLAQSEHYRDFPDRALNIMEINVRATVELADWALKHDVKKFIFSSTGSVYGPGKTEYLETDQCNSAGMYASSKFSAEMLLKPFSEFMSVTVLRLFCVYGAGQKNAMLPNIIERFMSDNEITLAQGVGVKFNPIYVNDCADVIVKIANIDATPGYDVLNVGGTEVVDLKCVVDFLQSKTGKEGSVSITNNDATYAVGVVKKLNNLFPFENPVGFEDGLARVFKCIMNKDV